MTTCDCCKNTDNVKDGLCQYCRKAIKGFSAEHLSWLMKNQNLAETVRAAATVAFEALAEAEEEEFDAWAAYRRTSRPSYLQHTYGRIFK